MAETKIGLSWCQGYESEKLHFVAEDTVCHICGNSVKFHSQAGDASDFHHGLRNLAQLAAQSQSRVFAVAESGVLRPRVAVHSFPDFAPLGEPLEGAGELEITALAFSSSQYLYALSGVPDFHVSLWDFRAGRLLRKVEMPHVQPQQLSVSPVNWRLAALLHDTKVVMLEVERCQDLFEINVTSLRLPPIDAEAHSVHECSNAKSRVPTRSSTAGRTRGQLELPESAMAGLDPQFAGDFADYKDASSVRRMSGRSLAWSDIERDFYVGCSDGALVRYDDDSKSLRVLHNQLAPVPRHLPSAIAEEEEEEEEDHEEEEEEEDDEQQRQRRQQADEAEVSFDHLALTTSGLFAGGADGCVRLLELTAGAGVTSQQEVASLSHPVCSLVANAGRLAVGSGYGGGISVMSLAEMSPPQLLYAGSHGNFVGAAVLPPGNELVATAREGGLVQVWETSSRSGASRCSLVGSLSLSLECTAFAGSPAASVAFVGAEDGSLSIVDLAKPKEARLVCRHFLHAGTPVNRIAVDPEGRLFATASSDGHVFVGSALPSEKFRVVGGVAVEGKVQALAAARRGDCVQLLALHQLPADREPCRVTFCEIGRDLLQDPAGGFGSSRGQLDDAKIKKATFRLDAGSYGCALVGGEQPWFLTVSRSTRQLLKYKLPVQGDEEQEPQISADIDSFTEIVFDESAMQLQLSLDGGLLLAFGADGRVTVVSMASKDRLGSVAAHSYTSGGVLAAVVSLDGKFLVTSGFDGSLCRFSMRLPDELANRMVDWQLTNSSDSMSSLMAENSEASQLAAWSQPRRQRQRRESDSEDEEAGDAAAPATWLQEQEQVALAEEDRRFADKKRELRDRLGQMRSQIREMVDVNAGEGELEKLDPHEFELDLDEQSRFAQDTEVEVAGVRRRVELDNLAKQFLASVIRRSCWEEMEVKGRSIGSFSPQLEVCNYPLRPLAKAEQQRLEQVAKRRVVEISEAKERREQLESQSREQQQEGEEEEEAPVEDNVDSITLQGGTAERFGVLKSMFYSQFDMHSREQKINQIVLLQDSIRHVKQSFNRDFDEVYKKKEQEMSKIRERNFRLKKIVADLNLDVAVSDPEFSVAEKPELLFTVNDDEVKVEKYLTPEQRKKLEEERHAEEERLRRERLDNWRERGLDQMMGGVLEIKKEDELKKDIPKPAFMTNKLEAEWNEEERRQAEDYERRVKELQEEREKYKKQLEAELKKLQAQTEENMSSFDQELKQLFVKKVKTQAAVVQEELKIYRLRLALLVEEEYGARQRELSFQIGKRKQELEELGPLIDRSRKLVKAQDDEIQFIKSDNEYLEKNYSAFKKEFPEISSVLAEQLHKLYKKKVPQLKMKSSTEVSNYDPYSKRPTTARRQEGVRQALDALLREQDDERNMPSGLEPHVWQRFCQLRRSKREREMLVSDMTLALSEFQAFVTARESEYNHMQLDVENLKLLNEQLLTQRSQFITNLEVQLLVRQGQVEVEPSENFIIDFADSLLLHRGVVEDLNSKIKSLGEAKVGSMEDAKDSKKTFRRLEWELRGMRMEAADLLRDISDINSFKITREIQRYLATDDYEGLITSEIQKLDQAIELMKKHHQKMVEMKETRLKELKDGKCAALEAKNDGLDSELEDMNVSVNERLHIEEVNAEKRDEAQAAKKRYDQILQRQRLVDLAKAQAKEVAVLRAEVERLRMRTFPALVHNK